DRRLALRAGCLPDRGLLPAAPRPGRLSRPLRVPARALPRRAAGHLYVDPVRRRPPPLPRRELRDARDEDFAARRAVAERAVAARARREVRAPPEHHAEPAPRQTHRAPCT